MRLVTLDVHGVARPGALRTGSTGELEAVDLLTHEPTLPPSIKQILAAGPTAAETLQRAIAAEHGHPLSEVKLLAPILDPQKIICVGLNYADHAAETGAQAGDEPVIFCKFPTTIRGPEAPIELPPESNEVDYEAELVVVIGSRARRVSRADALDHVGGFTCGNDVSARDWQKGKPGKQWLLGKSFDSFAPLGPCIVTRDELADPGQLDIEMRLNGEVMQRSNTRQLIFPVDYLVSYLSHVCTLLPGDLIFTGTPAGVGMARSPQVFLKAGDVCEVSITGIGSLRNPVKIATEYD